MIQWAPLTETPQMLPSINEECTTKVSSPLILWVTDGSREYAMTGVCMIDEDGLHWTKIGDARDMPQVLKWAYINDPYVYETITEASFTNRIVPKEGFEVRATNHFLQRWNSRLKNRSPKHLNEAIENKDLRYMCTDSEYNHHFLYKDEEGVFWILMVGRTGGLRTILTEKIYRSQLNAVNLSEHKNSFLKRDEEREQAKNVEDKTPEVKVEEKRIPNVSEYQKKITADATKIKQLETSVSDLQKKYDKDTESLKKRLKTAIKRAEINESQVTAKVLSRGMDKSMFNNKECIAITAVLTFVFIQLLKLF